MPQTPPQTDPYAPYAAQAPSDPYASYASQGGGVPSAHTSPLPTFGSSLSDVVSTVGAHLKNMVAGPYHAMTDAPQNPAESGVAAGGPPGSLALYRMLAEPSVSALSQISKKNTFDENANHAMDALPVVGPWARQIENDTLQKGAVAGLAGLGTDILAPTAATKALGAGLRVAGFGTRMAAATPASRDLAVTRAIVPGEPAQLLTRALKPSVAYPEFEQSAEQSLPAILKHYPDFEQPAGQSLPAILKQKPSPGVRGFADATDAAKASTAEWYKNLKAPHANEPLDTTGVKTAQQSSIPPKALFEEPGLKGRTNSVASRYGKQVTQVNPGSDLLSRLIPSPVIEPSVVSEPPLTLGQADEIRVGANQELKGYYSQPGASRFAAESNPELSRTKAVGDSLRDVIYPKLSALSGVPEEDIRANQDLYGHLADVGDVAGKRATVYGRQNPFSLQESLAATPGRPLSGAVDFIGQRLLKNATGSDALVNSALDRFVHPTETPLLPRAELIPRMGMAAGEAARTAGKSLGRLPLYLNPLFYGERRDSDDD